jgi:hypothetical protein
LTIMAAIEQCLIDQPGGHPLNQGDRSRPVVLSSRGGGTP